MSARRQIIASVIFVVAGAFVSMGPPRLTLTNAGLSVEYPWFRGAGALVAAFGAALLALAVRRRWPRVAAGALAALGLAVGVHLLAYRLEADAAGLSARGLSGSRAVGGVQKQKISGWTSFPRTTGSVSARTGPNSAAAASSRAVTRIEVDTTDFRPEQRASLERTIARRVRDSSPSR